MVDGPDAPTAGYLVWRLAMKWRTAVDQAMRPFGLTHATYVVLSSLYGLQRAGRSPSQRELSDWTGLDVVYVSRLAQTLDRRGLIARRRDPADTRAVALSLTDAGREVVQPAMASVHAVVAHLTAPLGGPSSARTRSLMRDLNALLDAPLPLDCGASIERTTDDDSTAPQS